MLIIKKFEIKKYFWRKTLQSKKMQINIKFLKGSLE